MNSQQIKDAEECEKVSLQGNSKECLGCSCNVCLAQIPNAVIKIHIKNQLNDAKTIEFCLGQKEYKLKYNESVTVEVYNEDYLYFDVVKDVDKRSCETCLDYGTSKGSFPCSYCKDFNNWQPQKEE